MSITNRVLSVLLALAFLVLGIVTVVEIVGRAVGHAGHVLIPYARPARWLDGQTWTAHWVEAGLIVLAVLGLVLLISQLKPRTPGLLVLHSDVDGVDVAVPRASLAKAMTRVAGDVDGISAAKATLKPRTASVAVTSHLHDTTGLADRVESTVSSWLGDLGLERTPSVRVSLDQKER